MKINAENCTENLNRKKRINFSGNKVIAWKGQRKIINMYIYLIQTEWMKSSKFDPLSKI